MEIVGFDKNERGSDTFVDRYEKRHKNLAAHVSPAFRVDVGDVVTVGTYHSLH